MGNKIQRIYVGDHYQVYPKTVPQVGLLGYRPLQSDLKDYSGNGNDGSWYSGTGTFETAGNYIGARVTENSSTYLATQLVTLPSTLNYHNIPITLCCWARFNSLSSTNGKPDWAGVVADNDSSKGFLIGIKTPYGDSNKYLRFSASSVASANDSTKTVTTGQWYFFAMTVDSSGLIGYKDGSQIVTVSGTPTTFSTSNWRIGAAMPNSSSYQGTDGWVRQCAIYNRALTANEILDFYNTTK